MAQWVAYERYEKAEDAPGVEFIAVNIDPDKDRVPPFVEEHGYRFDVLFADGRVEADYLAGGAVPQLFVIDRAGNIRLHYVGFGKEHFLEDLDLMIEAAAAGE